MTDSSITERLVHDVAWFIWNTHLKSEITVEATASRESVTVRIGCMCQDYSTNPLDFVSQEHLDINCFDFDVRALAVYNGWLNLKDCGGSMSTEFQKDEKIIVVITLPIYNNSSNTA